MKVSVPHIEDPSSYRERLQHLRYLLVVPIPFYKTPDGRIWLDQLWHHDLMAHLDYLTDLTILAPEIGLKSDPITGPNPRSDIAEVIQPEGRNLTFVRSTASGGLRKLLPSIPHAIMATWYAVGRADLIHSGVAGWPVPAGLFANPISWLRRKPLIIVIESAFWRPADPVQASFKTRLRARLTEAFARWSLRRAKLGIYTHAGYRDTLPVKRGGIGVVLPASWIKDANLLAIEAASRSWAEKSAAVRFLLPSRLAEEKGISVFIEAARHLEENGRRLEIDVIGAGPLAASIAELAEQCQSLKLRLLDPVPYGAPFMELLRGYHAVIVPTTGDEQPRILYDTFAQAMPVIASDTAGNLEVVRPDVTGKVFRCGSASSLAASLSEAAANPDLMKDMGMKALETANTYTHTIMHAKRAAILAEMFGRH